MAAKKTKKRVMTGSQAVALIANNDGEVLTTEQVESAMRATMKKKPKRRAKTKPVAELARTKEELAESSRKTLKRTASTSVAREIAGKLDPRATRAQVRALWDVAQYGDPYRRVSGRSAHGGMTSVLRLLVERACIEEADGVWSLTAPGFLVLWRELSPSERARVRLPEEVGRALASVERWGTTMVDESEQDLIKHLHDVDVVHWGWGKDPETEGLKGIVLTEAGEELLRRYRVQRRP